MSKARDIADLLDSAGKVTADDLDVGAIGGRRNLIINGAMQVWQRGTSGTTVGSAYTSVDRFRHRDSTISRSTDVPTDEGFKYSLFYDNDGTRTGINMRQIIEDGKLYTDNKAITLSFWVKGSIASDNCTVDFGDQQHTSFPLTTSWNRVVVSVPSYVRNVGNIFNGGLYVDFNFGTDYPDVHITGVQLELGSVATPFEHRSYGEELALCQRYYETGWRNAGVSGNNSGYFRGRSSYTVEKRAAPSFSNLMVTINNQVDNRTTSNSVSSVSKTDFIFQHYPSVNAYSAGSNGWYYYEADAEL